MNLRSIGDMLFTTMILCVSFLLQFFTAKDTKALRFTQRAQSPTPAICVNHKNHNHLRSIGDMLFHAKDAKALRYTQRSQSPTPLSPCISFSL
jgi:hypothetical protein